MPAGQGLALALLPHARFHRLYVIGCSCPMLIVAGMGRGRWSGLAKLASTFWWGRPAAEHLNAERGAGLSPLAGLVRVVAEHLHRISILKSAGYWVPNLLFGSLYFGGL
jgi:hypothetical protein